MGRLGQLTNHIAGRWYLPNPIGPGLERPTRYLESGGARSERRLARHRDELHERCWSDCGLREDVDVLRGEVWRHGVANTRKGTARSDVDQVPGTARSDDAGNAQRLHPLSRPGLHSFRLDWSHW